LTILFIALSFKPKFKNRFGEHISCAGMNQSTTEVSRAMYLTYSSLLCHFIECSTSYGQVSYLLQLKFLFVTAKSPAKYK